MKLVFIDKNEELVRRVSALFEKYKTNEWDYELEARVGDISKEKEELKKLESKIIEGLTFYYTNYCEEEREIAEERTYRLLEAYTQTLRKESYKEGYDNGAKEGVLED